MHGRGADMIPHIVMVNRLDDHNPVALRAVMDGVPALDIHGFTGLQHGLNRDLERKTPDFGYGFICTFDGLDALARYASDPTHQTLVAQLCALC